MSDFAPSPGRAFGTGWAVMPRSLSSRARSLLLDPGSDRRRRVAVKSPVEVFCDESDMRRRQQVLEGSERVLSRQGLGIENVDRLPRHGPCAQGLDERLLVDDRAARRVDQPRRRFHEPQFGGADETAAAVAPDEVDGYDTPPP